MRSTAVRSRFWSMIALFAPVLVSPGIVTAQTTATGEALTLDQLYLLVQQRSPVLRAAAAAVEASAAREASAGLPPDPTVQIGIMNFSVPGLKTDMPTAMAPSIQAMQMLPLNGRLGLSRRVAELETTMKRAGADEAWWEVRSRAAMLFYEIYETDQRIATMRESLRLLHEVEQVAKTMYATGEGRQSDVLRAGVEVARGDAELRRMEAMRTSAAARLNAMLARPSDTPVPAVTLGELPLIIPGIDTLRAWGEASRPMLEGARANLEQARTRGDLARREIWPDPTIGVEYGQRSGEMGTDRMGSVMLGFSIPIFAKSRQLRMRDEAAAEESIARAELADSRAGFDARIAEILAELERARTLVTLYRAEILPQAHANVQASLSSYRVGRVDFMTLLDAQLAVNEYEQEHVALLANYGRFIAELELTIGRELPRSSQVLAEVR